MARQADHENSTTARSPRRLWQVPVFLLGIGALTAYLLLRSNWTGPEVLAEARLAKARRLWEQKNGQQKTIITLAQSYLRQFDERAPRTAEAYLIWGSCLARSARAQSGTGAEDLWREAYKQLDRARELQEQLSETDLQRMRAALGEAGYHTNDDLFWVCRRLTRNFEGVDDQAEAYRILTLAYLKQQPPDYDSAMAANESLRQLPLLQENILGPARLQGGEILLQRKRHAEARKLLEKIGADAPAEILVRARLLRARAHQEEGQWSEAAPLWQEILNDTAHPTSERGEGLYLLGLCQRRLDQREAAARTWRACLRVGQEETAVAAALGLAELLLVDGSPEAIEHLGRAVRDVQGPEKWTNQHVEVKQACDLFERAGVVFRQKRDFARALESARLAAKLVPAGMPEKWSGVALRDWALALKAEGKTDGVRVAKMLADAGSAFEKAAAAVPIKERLEPLWQSATCYLEAGVVERAVTVLEQFLLLETPNVERAGHAWFLLGQALEQRKDDAGAEAAYGRSIACRGRYGLRARHRLGQIELARGNVDRAVDTFEQNLKQLHSQEPDDEALESTLTSLARVFTQRKNYAAARPHLEEIVAKFSSAPSGMRSRLELADLYRRLADQEHQNLVKSASLKEEAREHSLKQRRNWLTNAGEQYGMLAAALANPDAARQFSPQQQAHIFFSMADCRFLLGDYPEALKLYDGLADRYKDRLERLTALGGSARCHAAQRDQTRFQECLQDIRTALEGVDDRTRQQWEAWLSRAGKPQ